MKNPRTHYKVWIEIEKVTTGHDDEFPDDEKHEECDCPGSCVEEFGSYEEALDFATSLQRMGGGYVPDKAESADIDDWISERRKMLDQFE
jgi:hypothetical protein